MPLQVTARGDAFRIAVGTMTGEYTFVAPERQNELTRRIQEELAKAGMETDEKASEPHDPQAPPDSDVLPNLAEAELATVIVQ